MPFRRQNFISGRGIFHGTTELFVPRQEFQGESLAPVVHLYGSEEDTLATIEASGYFDELALTDPRPAGFQYPIVRVGDLIHVLATNGSAELTLTQISPVFTTQVTQPELVPGSVQTEDLVDLAVSTAKLADGSVTTPKIADNAVISSKLADNSVTTAKIVDLAVTGAKIADSTVTSTQLADNSVTTAKLGLAAVTTEKLAANSVDTGQLVSASVINAKMAVDSIDTAQLIAGSVTNAKMAANSVDTAQLIADSVTNAKLANDAVNTAEIVNSAVTNAKMAADSVDTSQIVNSAVTLAKLASASVDASKVTFITSGTHNTTWSGAWSPAETVNIPYYTIDNMAILFFPFHNVSAGASTFLTIDTVLPVELRPSTTMTCFISILQNNVRGTGKLQISPTGLVEVYATSALGNFTSGQNAGFDNAPVIYFLN